MATSRFREPPKERRPPRRWDTVKAIGIGLLLGLVGGIVYSIMGVRHWSVVNMTLMMMAGAAAGAIVLGLLVELRNRLFGAV